MHKSGIGRYKEVQLRYDRSGFIQFRFPDKIEKGAVFPSSGKLPYIALFRFAAHENGPDILPRQFFRKLGEITCAPSPFGYGSARKDTDNSPFPLPEFRYCRAHGVMLTRDRKEGSRFIELVFLPGQGRYKVKKTEDLVIVVAVGDFARVKPGPFVSTESDALGGLDLPTLVATKSTKKRSVLESLTTDLTALARAGELDPMVGRRDELERLVHILLRRTKNNPVLVGEPGVGKTSIVEGLASRIVSDRIPVALQGFTVRRLEVASLVAGTMYRGQFEDRLQKLIAELGATNRQILFIDEIHTVIGAGSAEGSLDAANILKPALTSGKLRVIGATTFAEYQRHIERDAAFERRFQPLTVAEPSVAEAFAMLKGLRGHLEAHHQLKIGDDALATAVELAHRHLAARRLPDSAIDVIDEAAAAGRAGRLVDAPSPIVDRGLERQLKSVLQEKTLEIKRQNFERAAFLRDRELKLKLQLSRQQPVADGGTADALPMEAVHAAAARLAGVPNEQLLPTLTAASRIAAELGRKIVGQASALARIAAVVVRSAAGLKPEHQPRSALVLVGPTGVGKTELAYALATQLYGTRDAVIRLDMSEFREPHTVARLVGAPPGYIGHEEAGRLTEAVRRRPAAVVLFDEIEKAHPDVLNLLLQVLDYGRLTDAKGRAISFRSTHVILTTNVGADHWTKPGLGFHSSDTRATAVRDAATALFRPELVNRLDDIVVFEPLSAAAIVELLTRHLTQLNERLERYGVTVHVARPAARELARRTLADPFGARGLQRLLATELEAPLIARLALRDPSGPTETVRLSFAHDQFALKPSQARAQQPTV